MKMLIFTTVLLVTSGALASSVQLEGGSTTSVYNFFQFPNDDVNRVNLPDLTGTSFRLTGRWDVADNAFLYFLYAPLTVDYNTQVAGNFEFNGTNFLGNTSTDVSYRFNSYRIGYLWTFGSELFEYWVGPVGKVRDADINVSQMGVSQSFSNVGFVPLLGAGFHYRPVSWWSLYFHFDGLYASQGSAYDAVLESRVNASDHIAVGLGYRILGGGADNDRLQNFAQFDTFTLSLIYDFGD